MNHYDEKVPEILMQASVKKTVRILHPNMGIVPIIPVMTMTLPGVTILPK